MRRLPGLIATGLLLLLIASAAPAHAQALYDDHELTDRFSISLGGFGQDDIRTTLRLDAKTPQGGIAIGAVIGLETLFDVEDRVNTWRIDGWYRFTKKHRINWTYWQTKREGRSTYNLPDPIDIGDITINPGDFVDVEDDSALFAASYSYSFVNVERYEAWIGGGLNFQTVDTEITVSLGGGADTIDEGAKATVPIPTLNIGGRFNFSKRTRMLFTSEFFGLKIGNYDGKRTNTRVLCEYNITKHFLIGGGVERYQLQVDAEGSEFLGRLDVSYTGLSLYVKGQL